MRPLQENAQGFLLEVLHLAASETQNQYHQHMQKLMGALNDQK